MKKDEILKKEEVLRLEREQHKKYRRRLVYLFLVIMILLFGGRTDLK